MHKKVILGVLIAMVVAVILLFLYDRQNAATKIVRLRPTPGPELQAFTQSPYSSRLGQTVSADVYLPKVFAPKRLTVRSFKYSNGAAVSIDALATRSPVLDAGWRSVHLRYIVNDWTFEEFVWDNSSSGVIYETPVSTVCFVGHRVMGLYSLVIWMDFPIFFYERDLIASTLSAVGSSH